MGEGRSVAEETPDPTADHGVDEETAAPGATRRRVRVGAHALALAGFAVLTLDGATGTRATVTFH